MLHLYLSCICFVFVFYFYVVFENMSPPVDSWNLIQNLSAAKVQNRIQRIEFHRWWWRCWILRMIHIIICLYLYLYLYKYKFVFVFVWIQICICICMNANLYLYSSQICICICMNTNLYLYLVNLRWQTALLRRPGILMPEGRIWILIHISICICISNVYTILYMMMAD